MTKTQTEQLAKNAADKNTDVQAMTVAEVERLDWDARRNKARDYARLATAQSGKEAAWFVDAYESRVLSIWGSKIKALEQARRNFKQAVGSMTVEQTTEKVKQLAASFNFRGARVDGHCLEVMRGDRDGATLYWNFKRDDGEVRNPDDDRQVVHSYSIELSVSTCGTSYSPARMALVHKIHGELLEAAAEIEATFTRERVVSTWGIPEAAPAVAEAVQA